MQLLHRALDLALRLDAFPTIQLDGDRARQSPVSTARDRHYHLQIAQQLGGSVGGIIGFALPLRFQKQLRLFQNPLTNGGGSVSPSGVQLSGFAAAEPVRGECFRHARAVVGTGACHRHQILRRQVRRNRPAAHLLLHAVRQQFDQGQPTRYPTRTAIKPARQLVRAVAEALLQFRQ